MGRRKTNLAKCFVISPNDSIFVAPRRRAAVSSGTSPLDHRCPPRDHRGVAQLVAHLVWDQRVACSSHVTPTFFIRGIPSPEPPSAFPPSTTFPSESPGPGRSPDGDVVASLLPLGTAADAALACSAGSNYLRSIFHPKPASIFAPIVPVFGALSPLLVFRSAQSE